MKNFPQIAARIFNKPLLLEPGYAQIFFGALSERMNIKSLIDINGKELSQGELKEKAVNYEGRSTGNVYRMVGDIAIIPVQGSLTHNLGTLHPYSGMTGYDGIEAKLNIAMNDDDVKGVLLDIDSPGGEVSGCFDLSDTIYSLRDTKPIWSVSNEFAASAAFAISSATSRIIVPRTAEVGSVGVLTAHVDQSKLLKARGVKVTLIYSGQHKVDGNPYSELSTSVKKQKQAEIDSIRELFVQTVARNRNVSYEHVFDTEARIYSGETAVDMKMADTVMSYNEALVEFQNHLSSLGSTTRGANNMAKTPSTSQTDELKAESFTEDDLKKAKAEGHSEGRSETIASERERFAEILNSDEAKGREVQAKHLAFSTSMSAEDVVAILATAHQAQADPVVADSPLDIAMANADQPGISGDSDGNEPSRADQMFASYQSATGYKKGE